MWYAADIQLASAISCLHGRQIAFGTKIIRSTIPYHPIPSIAWSLVLNPCRPPAQRASYPPPRHIVHCHAGPGGTINTNLTRQKDAKRIGKFYKLWPHWRSQRSAPLIHLDTEHLLHPRQVWDKAILSMFILVAPKAGNPRPIQASAPVHQWLAAVLSTTRPLAVNPGSHTRSHLWKLKHGRLLQNAKFFSKSGLSCFFGVPGFLILNSVHSIKMVKV